MPRSGIIPAVTRPESLGDRLEQAIERRTDVASEIARGEATEPPKGRLRKTVIWLAITGVSLYLVFPSLVQTFGSWRQVTKFSLLALAAMPSITLKIPTTRNITAANVAQFWARSDEDG